MIRLKPVPRPAELTPGKQKELTAKFKENGDCVWQQPYIKNALLKMSFNKCCYCECKIDEESKYLEVEHFLPKEKYKDKVVEWENLLPSCKRCNGKKGSHDTGIEPIIHPVNDEPKEHLYFKNYQIRAKKNSLLGKRTIELLALNDNHRVTPRRFQIGLKMIEILDELNNRVTDYFATGNLSIIQNNRFYSKLENLLMEAQPSCEYSAATAALLLNDEYYKNIKSIFIARGLWDQTLQELENEAMGCALDENNIS
jgi:uncharacterized protein (TIGR02646 family)